jgi:mannose-6-phosphate isomerase
VTVTQLSRKSVEKVWGRRDVPAEFGPVDPAGEPLGEVWFEQPGGGDPELLVKYLFTSERLSVQVHPDDAAARAAGYKRGKDEAWVVLRADPGAEIGIGLTREVTREALRAAALDGSIEALLDWRPAAAGDVYYSPAGTVHALGPGLALVEVQQNVDLTYRLYDYGRPRELHLEEGIAVSEPKPYRPPFQAYAREDGREILAEGLAFVLERVRGPLAATLTSDGPVWLIPLAGRGRLGAETLEAGSVWIVQGSEPLALEPGAELLIAYPGAEVLGTLLG